MKSAEESWEKVGFLTMVVESRSSYQNGIEGQSVLEFLLFMPFLMGLTAMTVRVNTAIQVSIVNQQYARSQALFLTYNHSFYPELSKTAGRISNSINQLVLGVADNQISDESVSGTAPKATVQLIAKPNGQFASDAPQTEPETRAKVRIRDTVTLCTPNLFLPTSSGGKGAQAILDVVPAPPYLARGNNALKEDSPIHSFCGSQVEYE